MACSLEPPASRPAPAASAASSPLDARLEAIDARVAKVETLRATFEQRKFTPLLKKPLVSSGSVVVKGGRTKWETTAPHPSTMTIDAGALKIFYPEQKVVEVYDLGSDVREFSGTPIPRLAKLRQLFAITQIKPSLMGAKDDDASLLAIELTPASEELKKHVKHVRVLIDTTLPCARRMDMEDADGERTEVEFRDIQVNTPVDDADVKLKLPEGVRETHPARGAANIRPPEGSPRPAASAPARPAAGSATPASSPQGPSR